MSPAHTDIRSPQFIATVESHYLSPSHLDWILSKAVGMCCGIAADLVEQKVTLTRKSSVLAAREMFIARWILLQLGFRVSIQVYRIASK